MSKRIAKLLAKEMKQTKVFAYLPERPDDDDEDEQHHKIWHDLQKAFYKVISVAIKADVTKLNWRRFMKSIRTTFYEEFGVLMIDFPWPEAKNFGLLTPGYHLMTEEDIEKLPLE